MTRVDKCEYKGIRYMLWYPKNYVEGKKYPTLFHLHGAGSRGNNFETFEGSSSVLFKVLENGDSELSNGFVIVPQCHGDSWFDFFSDLIDFAKYMYNQPFVDQTRFNGSGVSMGGYGIYQVMQAVPEMFHKALICCGGGMYWNSGRIKDIKFRIFHGANDEVVYPEEAIRMYNRLKQDGADVELTIYPDCDHNCWEKTFQNYDNLSWLFSK